MYFFKIILLSILCRPLHASTTELPPDACPYFQPIGINFGLDSITAAYAYFLNNVSMITGVPLPYRNDPFQEYKNSTEMLRRAYLIKSQRRMEHYSWDLPILLPVIDAISTMKKYVAGKVSLPVETSDFIWAEELFWGWGMVRESLCNIMSSLLMDFQPQSETEPEIPSDEYIKIGFVKAFEYLKVASMEQNIEIESALMLVPDFFNSHVRKLVGYAAIEAGVVSFGIESPQEMIKVYDEMFDDEITEIPEPIALSKPSIMIVDYGLQYLHLHTRGRSCQTKHALDTLGCSGIWRFLYYRFLTLDGPLKRQIEKGASRHDLFSALWQARFFMKQPMEEGQDHYEEWPLDLQDWWIGEQEGAVLRWEDVEAAESDYIDELANYLNQALDCLQEDKHSLRSNPIDRVYMLGNFCDRPIVKKAIQKSVGEHVKIIGGSSELDNGLAARGGARYAFVMAEPMNEVCRKEKLDYDEL